ncbi:M1 family metallopeptidase [Terricaulis silvestris]|uniref:Aminopeptidase n=1 Tax=Terricaulis silvestris TaxID=2686094 RepID=A0A6I6MIZ9_9CAUL|nr:M1 family metallopeptidase [Terricaulis silvestris]QGZ94579.1 Aminopeptidase N [Terricaulis silvestris]
MKPRSLAFAAMLLVSFVAPSSAQQSQRSWFEGGPTPLKYELALVPNVEAGTFTGDVRITINSDAELAAVTMNAIDLNVTRATIDNSQVATSVDAEAQTLTLTPRRALRGGRHTLRIQYNARILDDPYGLFRVQYQDDNGQTRRMIATQFEPADARRMLPLWDQPNRRAVFALTVTHATDQMAVGNMPVARTQRLSGGLSRTTFQDTPAMPSYLLFLAVGDFERITRDVDGVEVGVVVRRGQTARAQYALQAAEQSINYYHEYFGIRYPLPKLDMIGVPGAGGFGAMENWGAILYFDQFLLLDEARSNETDRQRVFSIVAHEIAHQWFGNLVTMNWWDDLWLNEGFASWMAAKAVAARHPDWQPWLSQLADGSADAAALDAREGTHPIVQTVNTIDDANLAFDDITYDKGLAVLRMLEAYVGEEGFRQGVRDYLNAHLYGNARTQDLWTAVQAASGQPVLEIARSYTTQPGFPLLTVQGADCRGRNSDGTIRITQRRFALDEVSRTNELWSIPVVAQRVGGEPVRAVLPPQAQSTIDVGACGTYIVNAGQSAFFRVKYDETNFRRLVEAFPQLDAADQLGLLLDYFAFGRSGDAPMTDFLELADRVPASADPVVITNTAESLVALATYAHGRPSEDAVRAYVRGRLQPYFARVGWDARQGESSNEGKLRATLIGSLAAVGDEAVIAEARRRAATPDAVQAGIRDAVLTVAAANATEAEYEALVQQARSTTDFVEQRRLWDRVAKAQDEALARRSLQMVLGDDITRQLRPTVLSDVAEVHPRLAWDFLVANRAAVEAFLDPLSRLEYPTTIADNSSDPAVADALIQYASNQPEGAQRTAAGIAASIRLKARTVRDAMPAVEQWIARRGAAGRGR